MKKLVLTMTLLAGATAGYSQGLINWVDYVPSSSAPGSGFEIEVFGPATAGAAAVNNLGNTANDVPAGTASYAGAPLTGAYEVGLYVGATASAAQAAVLTGTPIATTSFQTSGNGGAGYWAGGGSSSTTSLIATDPNNVAGAKVFIDIAAWSTAGGASSYASAITDGNLAGYSVASTAAVTEGGPSPAPPAGNLGGLGITDFSVGSSVPEPSTIALGIMGASAFLMRLRRK